VNWAMRGRGIRSLNFFLYSRAGNWKNDMRLVGYGRNARSTIRRGKIALQRACIGSYGQYLLVEGSISRSEELKDLDELPSCDVVYRKSFFSRQVP